MNSTQQQQLAPEVHSEMLGAIEMASNDWVHEVIASGLEARTVNANNYLFAQPQGMQWAQSGTPQQKKQVRDSWARYQRDCALLHSQHVAQARLRQESRMIKQAVASAVGNTKAALLGRLNAVTNLMGRVATDSNAALTVATATRDDLHNLATQVATNPQMALPVAPAGAVAQVLAAPTMPQIVAPPAGIPAGTVFAPVAALAPAAVVAAQLPVEMPAVPAAAMAAVPTPAVPAAAMVAAPLPQAAVVAAQPAPALVAPPAAVVTPPPAVVAPAAAVVAPPAAVLDSAPAAVAETMRQTAKALAHTAKAEEQMAQLEQQQQPQEDASQEEDDPLADLDPEDQLTGIAPGLADRDPTRGLGLQGLGFEDQLDGIEDDMSFGESLDGIEDDMSFGESLDGIEDDMSFGESLDGAEELSGEELGGDDLDGEELRGRRPRGRGARGLR